MLFFIDDSGDPGFKLTKGSSSHFVIACVIFDDNLDAEEIALKIKRLRRTINWHESKEFKFNKANQQISTQFLQAVKHCNFKIRAVLVDKSLIRSDELKGNKSSFYNYMIKEVLSKCGSSIQVAKVRLDGHEDRAYKKAATTYFRKQVSVVKDFKFVDSKSDNLIQLADMIAGTILRSAQGKAGSQEYIRIISSRVEDIWTFQ
jgi:hypothetical protein